MKQLSLIFAVVLFTACKSNVPFVPKTDTGVVTFWANKRVNPMMYVATWTPRRRLLPTIGDSTRNEWRIDTAYLVKLSDTTPDGKGGQRLDSLRHSIPFWTSVPDSLVSYIHILPTPKQ